MELWQIIVAIIQGLVEWLPISSEGQVVFFLFNFTPVSQNDILSLVVWLHLGTALAVVARYPRVILDILSLKDKKLFRLLLVATLCTAITGVPLYFFLEGVITPEHGELLNFVVGVLLLVTAIVLYLPTRNGESDLQDTEGEVENQEAAATGLVQGLAVLPGLSRSGVTISALLMQKIDKETAMKFSFLMSVPAVLAILLLDILTGSTLPANTAPFDLFIIEAVVFITGLVSMEFLVRLAKRVSFWKLCLVLAVIAILFGIPVLLQL
ncbi:MAG: undecaprenyl-diphosphate phosphatase [Candidatus Thorarchaeota archaeon]